MRWVEKIILINIAIFGICGIFSVWNLHLENLFALFPIQSENFSSYQLVSHLFIHGNIEHLFFNMLFFLFCGGEVEKYLGKNFISFYLLSGIFSSGLYCLGSDVPMIGASGAVFSVMTLWILLMINSKKPKTTIGGTFGLVKTIFLVYYVISEVYYATLSLDDNIAHWAHVFGSIFACLYYIYMKSYQRVHNI